ncbi:hypothetical protein CC80DRAFT_73569 [Byssothecium circinans]|uniref:RRM domain-containing protein n=1 Tax=Byssothecium circinans TaxID=147558 RepID=A0A6A5TV15_9PLEO|nr:hypothetical protein CC80DRAFT_73569 [Byssothecium circinans]
MAPPSGANGVIPITVLQKNPPTSAPRGPKAPAPRLKLVCRRLPPGLTKAEFENILGEEWKVGGGKIDWLNYRKGKISKDVAKPSKPSRAYLHVTQHAYVLALGDRIREVTFHDAAKSFQDAALVGPPTLEYAPYPKLPGGRRRNDARQGTIDQDPEFKEFLESLTAPITKPAAPEADPQKEEVKTTPLIEALREKKANKDKPQGKSKNRGETKESAADKKALAKSGKDAATAGDKSRNLSKAERERAQKEAVKALNKEAASVKAGAGPSTDKTAPAAASPAPERKRGNVQIAKSILQHDLGFGPAPNRRRGTKREINPAKQEIPGQDENATSKQKAKESPAVAAATATEKVTPASPKKERPSRAERRAFKASLADKTNSKTVGEDSKAPAKPSAPAPAPAPTIPKKAQAVQAQTPTAPKGPAAARAPPTEPAAIRSTPAPAQANPPPRPANPTPAHAAQGPTSPTVKTEKCKTAFLKHANASQGITEPLIEEALKVFGDIEKVEIDRRKGFAYVFFTDADSLAKAIAASPVKVAQGAVQVLEWKEKIPRRNPFTNNPDKPFRPQPAFNPRGRAGRPARGGRGGARGGGHIGPADGSPAPTAAVTAPPAVSAGGDVAT